MSTSGKTACRQKHKHHRNCSDDLPCPPLSKPVLLALCTQNCEQKEQTLLNVELNMLEVCTGDSQHREAGLVGNAKGGLLIPAGKGVTSNTVSVLEISATMFKLLKRHTICVATVKLPKHLRFYPPCQSHQEHSCHPSPTPPQHSIPVTFKFKRAAVGL